MLNDQDRNQDYYQDEGQTLLTPPDQYLSYDIKTASLRSHKVKLRDQFISWSDFVVGKPIQLLNPTLTALNVNSKWIREGILA